MGPCSGSTQKPRCQSALGLYLSLTFKNKPRLLLARAVDLSPDALSLKEKAYFGNLPLWGCCSRGGTSVLRRCHHGHICVVTAKKENTRAGEENPTISLPSTRSRSEHMTPDGPEVHTSACFAKSKVDSLLPSLLSGSHLLSRRIQRTLISLLIP